MLFHLLGCHENVFYNHANVCIGSVEVNGYPWGTIDIAISKVLASLEPCFYARCIVRMVLKRLTGKTFFY